jgi:YegS/Rv2252/BmrU family lipid kinase
MDNMHFTLIVNPISGRGNGLKSIGRIQTLLDGYHLDYEIVKTENPGHAIALTKQYGPKSDFIISVGGDGTSNEVINGLMELKKETGKAVSMGVIPVGRGNDFAYSMGIPADLELACEAISKCRTKTIDIGIAYGDNFPNGRYFGNGVGVGFDAVVGFEALKMKKLKGFFSYIVAALKTIFIYYKAPTLEVETDREKFQITALMVSIMNGIRMGGGFFMAPEGNPCDNIFDLCCVTHVSKMKTFPLMAKFMQGKQGGHSAVRFIQAKKVTVTAIHGSIPAHADGETVCTEGKKIYVELLPSQIELITAK